MPPRSANRRASSRAKKSTPTSKQPDLESVNLAVDEITPPPDSEIKEHELRPSEEIVIKLEDELAEAKVKVEEPGLPHPVIEAINSDSVAIDCSNGGLEGVAKDFVKEEMVVEEASADTVMEDGANEYTAKMEGIENGSVHEKNHNSNPEDLVQNAENVDEGNKEIGVGVEHNSGEAVSSDGSQPVLTPEINSAEVLTVAAQNNCGSNNVLAAEEDCIGEGEGEESDDDGANNDDSEEDNDDNQDEEDPSLFLDASLTGTKKDKNLEIYIGRLAKETVEDDLIKIFGKFGELKSTRIVRNPTTKKSKGFAFIQFASADHAKNALSELKDGVEVKGKHVKISASQENDTIYVGNICKTWSKEDVLGTLKQYGIEHFEEIHLPDDPKNDGKIKGFALLEFSTHSDAMTAFNRLRKPDAVFGRDKSAKVAFTQTPMHPSKEVLSQVKRVYLEGLTKAWNEEKVKEICSQYGEIIKINICRSPSTKRKDFGFVTYTSREGALACVEGINRAHIKEGEVEVKANIAKPQHKGRLQKQGFHGGFKVEKRSQVSPLKKEGDSAKEAESSKTKVHTKSKQAKGKSRTSREQKKAALSNSSNVERGNPRKIQGKNVGTTSKSERANPKRKKPLNVEDHMDGGTEHTGSKRPSKKPRGNERGKQMNNSRNPNRDRHFRKGRNYSAESSKHRNSYATGYAVSPAYHQGHAHPGSGSALKRHYTDMEPHAGYLDPVVVEEGRLYSGYVELGSATPFQSHSGYLEPAAGRQGLLQTRYLERTVLTQSHAGYIQNAVRTHVESHAGYLQPALVQRAHDPYSSGLRAGGHDGQGSSGSGYGGVVSAVPASYVPNHTRYAGYEDGGNYYQNGGAYPPPRTYY